MMGRKNRRMYWRKATSTPGSIRSCSTAPAPYHKIRAVPTVDTHSVKGKKMA